MNRVPLLRGFCRTCRQVFGDCKEVMNRINEGIRRTDTVCIETRPGGKRVSAGGERGGSLVEFALVMPMLLILITGVTSFGISLHNLLVLTNGVNVGAQLLSISRGQTTDPCATAYSAISTAAPNLTSGLTLSFVINGATYSSTDTCTAGASNMVQGASAEVSGTYPCTLTIFRTVSASCTLKAQVTEFIQ
jgi:Flp pilus assembly protein TadG